MFRPRFAISTLCVAIASVSVSYADGFYTIIGPDGRPMIVPSKKVEQKQSNIRIEAPKQVAQPKSVVIPVQEAPFENLHNSKEPKKFESRAIKKLNTAPTAPTAPTSPELPLTVSKTQKEEVKKQTSSVNTESVPAKIYSSSQSTSQTVSIPDPSNDRSKFTSIDGVEYVNNEYLEDQEFNLEGKKRFYVMPDGLGRTEFVERKKGLSKSTLEQFFNKQSQEDQGAIVLAPTYIRLSQKELETTFEQDKCFVQGYKKSIKVLRAKKEVNLWPRKPLKEKFEYELVKLEPSVQHLQLMSFAASNSTPLYYWPLAIFLDEKGCILEGASGFKSKSYPSTILQHASIQGTLRVPPHARYMMLTPLSSSVDVAEQELSNQGQIQISVLR
ncbi:putative pilus assembly protein FilE [Acinetobacter nosocomialis]|uniref:putative pilus assembly protein FilE n=1 Tax=Acinetobacter nosocomialis TaxID=106654 RepID=UPI003BF50A0D